ncbi:MAG TPA: hypothetical protein VIY98_09190 [Nitrososphaeraceae archaeon]
MTSVAITLDGQKIVFGSSDNIVEGTLYQEDDLEIPWNATSAVNSVPGMLDRIKIVS